MKKLKVWSQGDLVIVEAKIPKNALEVENPDGELLRGEATGHRHRIVSGQARYFRSAETEYAYALTDLQVGHEDHPGFQQMIPAGTSFRYGPEREADWFSESTRNVLD